MQRPHRSAGRRQVLETPIRPRGAHSTLPGSRSRNPAARCPLAHARLAPSRTPRGTTGALAALGLALPLAADAAQGPGRDLGAQAGYSEFGVSQSEWDAAALNAFSAAGGPLTSSSLDKNGTPWGRNAGCQRMRFFAIEAAYCDPGKASAQGTVPSGTGTAPPAVSGEFKPNGPALALVAILPLGPFSSDRRTGACYGTTEASRNATVNGVSGSASESKSGATVMGGADVACLFNDYRSLRRDHLSFDKVGGKDTTGQASVNVGTLGGRFHFLSREPASGGRQRRPAARR
jgi:hypothetical protein